MAYIVMAYTVMAYACERGMHHLLMACVVMAYIVVAHIVMACALWKGMGITCVHTCQIHALIQLWSI